jgi:hypothetical protein
MTYALGRRLEPSDMPAVRRVIRGAAAQDYRIGAFVQGIVESAAFQMSRPPVESGFSRTIAAGGSDRTDAPTAGARRN